MNRRDQSGISLVELLIAVALVGILAATLIPSASPVPGDALSGAAQVLAGDLEYGRELAVSNNSRYRFTFDVAQNRYILEHSGTNASLEVLPPWPFRSPTDPPDQQIVVLNELPQVGVTVQLRAAEANSQSLGDSPQVEFGPLGETTSSAEVTIWLSAGSGAAERFVPIRVNPVTGIASIGELQAVKPTAVPAVAADPAAAGTPAATTPNADAAATVNSPGN
jgi:prepilin-type N-terminal cleavage/methylation domain-containing protein